MAVPENNGDEREEQSRGVHTSIKQQQATTDEEHQGPSGYLKRGLEMPARGGQREWKPLPPFQGYPDLRGLDREGAWHSVVDMVLCRGCRRTPASNPQDRPRSSSAKGIRHAGVLSAAGRKASRKQRLQTSPSLGATRGWANRSSRLSQSRMSWTGIKDKSRRCGMVESQSRLETAGGSPWHLPHLVLSALRQLSI